MKKYKSILGLNTVKAFVIIMLSLAIISVIFLVVLSAINTSNVIALSSRTALNEVGRCNHVPYQLLNATVDGFQNPSLTSIINTSLSVPAANCTVDASGWVVNATSTEYNGTIMNYTYQYYSDTRVSVNSITSNSSNAVSGFFGNSVTFFALLGVVVIILIISLVVVVVNRFGGEGGGGQRTENPSL